MLKTKKIFNDMGFLTKEGEAFVQDRFAKEMKSVFNTVYSSRDVLVVSSILKSLVDNYASKMQKELSDKENSFNKSDSNKIDPFDIPIELDPSFFIEDDIKYLNEVNKI